MKKEQMEKIKREQDLRLALTLKLMDESPIIQKVTKMTPFLSFKCHKCCQRKSRNDC